MFYDTVQEAEEARKRWSETSGAQSGGCRYAIVPITDKFAVARIDPDGKLIGLVGLV